MKKVCEKESLLHTSPLRPEVFYKQYISLKEDIDELLASCPQSNYLVSPAVDIEKIARLCGIKDIVRTTEDKCGRHGKLEGDVIFLNEAEPLTKQRFCIAHEIGHIRLNLFDNTENKQIAARRGIAWRSNTAKNIIEQFTQRSIEESLKNMMECVQEELVDYYAANLLIPLERFLLWEDKTDIRIADAFTVDEKCIAKRRTEITKEIEQLTPADATSSFGISGTVLSSKEIDSILKTF